MVRWLRLAGIVWALLLGLPPVARATPPDAAALKDETLAAVEQMRTLTQQMVDQIFSYSELGFQEFETAKYVTGLLGTNGFKIDRGVAGMPTAWVASWGHGKPVIGFIADIDCIPRASQKPGVAFAAPIVDGAPGHGEGHNAGLAVNVTAALALKAVMHSHKLAGTLKIYPGVAEELVAAKAYFVRAGVFEGVDLMLAAHVSTSFSTSYGQKHLGIVSVRYDFHGTAAHAGMSPWSGRSALDAVELMDMGWNMRREHLRTEQRSHSVILNGGDQPNVVPSEAAVWYYLRETTYDGVKNLYDTASQIARGATMMTGTTVSERILGSAWPDHMNKTMAEVQQKNIEAVGAPLWSSEDQALAKAAQKELGGKEEGLSSKIEPLGPASTRGFGGSDDTADISWVVPTVYLRYPANIPGLPGHHWASSIAMATPIAHRGATAGAKVQAGTALDFLLAPDLVAKAWDYFREQTKTVKYTPFMAAKDKPAVELNREKMAQFAPQLRKFYFDPSRYKTYLEQLGITYPTLKRGASK